MIMKKSHNIAQWLLVILVNVIILEISSYAVALWARSYKPHYFQMPLSFYEEDLATIDDEYIEQFKSKAYSPILGWDNKPNTQRTQKNTAGLPWTATFDASGARTNSLFKYNTVISSYGDSHTLCAEVNDDETWQYYLSRKIEANVQNFGVGGYGTDQALLKLERNLKAGIQTPYVILGIHQENITRIVNTFRPFLRQRTRVKLGFKPRFVVENGNLKLIPNPMPQLNTLADAIQALSVAE